MADDLRVIVDADADPLVRELRRAGVEVRGFGSAVSRTSPSARAFSAAVDKQKESLRGLATFTKHAAFAVGTGLVLALGHAVKVGIDFESQMARVQAVTGATSKQMDRLRALAIKLGADTKFSAGEAAEAMYELSSAGFSVKQTSDALPGTLSLAAASNIELAAAAEISSNALRGFGLNAGESTHVADVLAKSVNTSSLEMEDLQLSLKYIGPVATATGESFEQMIAAVSLMGNAGIKGEQAGTTLRAGLIRLVKPTKQVEEGLKLVGLSAQDLYGPNGLLPLPELVGKLQEGMGGLSKAQQANAIASIFGTEAYSGMQKVVEAGPAKLRTLTTEFEHSTGASAQAAKTMNTTVAGAVDELKGSVETVEIELFTHFQKPLRETLLDATGFVNLEGERLQKALGEAMATPEFKTGDFEQKFDIIAQAVAKVWNEGDLTNKIEEGMVAAFNFAIPRVAAGAGHLGVEAAKGLVKGFFESDALGKLVISAWLFSKLGGFAAIRAAGLRAGLEAGAGIAEGTAEGAATGGTASIFTGRLKGLLGRGAKGAGIAVGGGAVGDLVGGDAGNIIGKASMGAGLGMLFGPEGAAIGGAGGALVGALEDVLSEGKKVTVMQGRMAAAAANATDAMQSQRNAAQGLARAHEGLHGAEARSRNATNAVHRAEEQLSQDRKKFGADSNRVREDELLLATAKHKDALATQAVSNAHKLAGNALKLYRHETVEAVAAEKARLPDLEHQVAHLQQKYQADQDNYTLLKRLVSREQEAAGVRKSIRETIDAAEGKTSKDFAARLRRMTAEQAVFGHSFTGLKISAEQTRDKLTEFARLGSAAWQSMGRKATSSSDIFKEDATSLSEATGIATRKIETRLAAALEKMGVARVTFGAGPAGPQGPVGKQRGGHINLGAPSGDSVPAMLERDEYVLNRNAVSAMGGPKVLDAVNFGTARRFQGGGRVGPEPQLGGPSGALRSIGQGAIHQVWKAAQAYLEKHAPHGGPGYSGPPIGPAGTSTYKGVLMATWVRQALEFAAAHGSGDPQPTSGYRSHAQNVAEGRTYISEHEKTQYPGGAVDFGGMVDPASLPLKMAVVNATRGFKYPLLAPAGFRDDGHASGTGHQLGGLVQALIDGGLVVQGKTSYFSPGDAPNTTADGKHTAADPGFAIRDHETLGDWFWAQVGGKSGMLQHIDWGPAASTGRAIDFTKAGLEKLGASTNITDSTAKVSWLGTTVDAAAKAMKEGDFKGQGRTDGEKTKAEAVARKRAREARLDQLRERVAGAKTLPAKQSALWRLLRFWGRVGIFDKGERQHILDGAQEAESKLDIEGRVGVLSRLASFTSKHGEVTGRDPENFHELEDAIKKAEARGKKEREREADKHERQRNRKKARIEARGEFAGLAAMLEGLQRSHGRASESAERLVALEPEELTDGYVGQERGAWGSVLEQLAGWRDKVVYARNTASTKVELFQGEIQKIKELKGDAFQKQKWRIKPLREAITNAQEFIAERGTDLEDFQGIGGPQTMLGSLGEGTPWWLTLGGPGRSIFDTQNTIRELGLKVADGGGSDVSAWTAAKEAIAQQTLQELAVSQGETRVFGQFFRELGAGFPFLGAYMQGTGGKRIAQTGLAILHRDEQVVPDPKGPAGTQPMAPAGGGGAPQITLVLRDRAGQLVELVDARVDGKLAKVDQQLGVVGRRRMVSPGRV